MATTIAIQEETKADLDKEKLIPQEPYDSVIKRLLIIKGKAK